MGYMGLALLVDVGGIRTPHGTVASYGVDPSTLLHP